MGRWISASRHCVLHSCQTSGNFLVKLDTGSETIWDGLEQKESSCMWCFADSSNVTCRYCAFLPKLSFNQSICTATVTTLMKTHRLKDYWKYTSRTHCSGNHPPDWSQQYVPGQRNNLSSTASLSPSTILQILKQSGTADLEPDVEVLLLTYS